ncbi:hypothetical protein FRX31_006048 [Thalictrum thalictroides]|uniref:Uncharacterized protein n=1 Tax=Thalictrum thalictroides TaxID=46969 RepID=A0A7J6X6A5_THATH|nr:hypothetical protein FRX31_006048 [Thalictrum thalictroides]
MKKKNCSQEHFIQTIKGGLVLKVMNIDSHGQPTIKFKRFKAICESESARKLSIASSVDEQEGIITSEANGKRKRSMTLKERRERKRTLSTFDETESSPGSISCSKINLNVDVKIEAAYEENLSIMKMKLMAMKTANTVIQIHDMAVNNGLEEAELHYGGDESVPDSSDEDDKDKYICDVNPNVVISEHLEVVADNYASTQQEKLSFHKDTDSVLCYNPMMEVSVANELDIGSIQLEDLSCHKDKNSLTQMLDISLSNNLPCTELHCGGDDESLPDSNGEDDKEDKSNEEISVTNDLGSEIYASSLQGNLSLNTDGDTVTQMLDLTLNNVLRCTELCDGINEIVPDSDDEGDNKVNISDLKLNVGESKSSTYIHDIVTSDTPQPMELSNGGGSCGFGVGDDGDIKKDISPQFAATHTNICDSVSSQDSYPSLSPNNVSVLMVNGPLTDEGQNSSLTFDVKEALQDSSGIHSSDATNGVKDVETLEGCLREDKDIYPKRLLSTRMVISPTSQEKLCQGLNVGDSCDNEETFNCRKKLFVEEQSERKNSLGELCVEGVNVKTIPRQNVKKQIIKNSETGFSQSHSKGSLKAPPFSHCKPHTRTKYGSQSTCAQKAITFSQKQMLDIETLALKLMKKLQDMNAIVKETLRSEVCHVTSKYRLDKVCGSKYVMSLLKSPYV